jgi:hypothetical protein
MLNTYGAQSYAIRQNRNGRIQCIVPCSCSHSSSSGDHYARVNCTLHQSLLQRHTAYCAASKLPTNISHKSICVCALASVCIHVQCEHTLVGLLLHTAVLCYSSACYQHLYHCCICTCTVRLLLADTVSYSFTASTTVSVTVTANCNYLNCKL